MDSWEICTRASCNAHGEKMRKQAPEETVKLYGPSRTILKRQAGKQIKHFYSEVIWGEFNSDDHFIHYCGQESLRRNGVAIIVNRRVWNAVLGCHLKNDRMISVHFQGKPFNITVIQAYAPTNKAEEAEVEWFYEDLQELLELTTKKDVLFIIQK